jgi:ketosteroid isomerase-like protein
VALASPDVEWEDAVFWSEPARTYRGRAEVREWFDQVLEPWESLQLDVQEITDAPDDRVFFELLLTGCGKGSGVETQLDLWFVCWIADGKVTRRKVTRERADVLEAAGLSE